MLGRRSLLGCPPRALAPVDDSVLRENLVSSQATSRTNNAAVRQTGPSTYETLGLQDVTVAYLETLTDWANLEDIVVADDHDGHSAALHTLSSVDNLGLLLYEVALAFIYKKLKTHF